MHTPTTIWPSGGSGSGPVPPTPFNPDSVPGLVIDLDARDAPDPAYGTSNPLASIVERKYGYTFAGAAERGSRFFCPQSMSENIGLASIDFNWGHAGDILTTTAPVTQLAGAKAVTILALVQLLQDVNAPASVFVGTGPGAVDGDFLLYGYGAAPAPKVSTYAFGNVGATGFAVTQSLLTPQILTGFYDFNLPTGQTQPILANNEVCTVGGVVVATNVNTGTFLSRVLTVGDEPTATVPCRFASFGKVLVYARATPLNATELAYLSAGIGAIWNVPVAP